MPSHLLPTQFGGAASLVPVDQAVHLQRAAATAAAAATASVAAQEAAGGGGKGGGLLDGARRHVGGIGGGLMGCWRRVKAAWGAFSSPMARLGGMLGGDGLRRLQRLVQDNGRPTLERLSSGKQLQVCVCLCERMCVHGCVLNFDGVIVHHWGREPLLDRSLLILSVALKRGSTSLTRGTTPLTSSTTSLSVMGVMV